MNKNENEMVGCVFKKLGTTHINDEGIDILKKSMGLIQVPTVRKDIDMEEIINMISDKVTLNIKDRLQENKGDMDIKLEEVKEEVLKVSEESTKDYQDLKNEMELLKKQNNELMEMMQDQMNKKSIFDIFKKKDKS